MPSTPKNKKKKNQNNYYVYIYLDPRKPGKYVYPNLGFGLLYEPFYVGAGHGRRYKSHLSEASRCFSKRNQLKLNKIRKIFRYDLEPIIIKLKIEMNKLNAFNEEKHIIKNIGRYDLGNGPLTNLTDGGETPINQKWSKERRKNHSKIFTELNKNKEYKEKVSRGLKNFWSIEENRSKRIKEITDSLNRPEVKKKISKIQTEIWKNRSDEKRLEHKNKIKSAWNNDELRNKISDINKGNTYGTKNKYKIIDPTGKIYIVDNLSKFCEENNLNVVGMNHVAFGRQKSHKNGWKCSKIGKK